MDGQVGHLMELFCCSGMWHVYLVVEAEFSM